MQGCTTTPFGDSQLQHVHPYFAVPSPYSPLPGTKITGRRLDRSLMLTDPVLILTSSMNTSIRVLVLIGTCNLSTSSYYATFLLFGYFEPSSSSLSSDLNVVFVHTDKQIVGIVIAGRHMNLHRHLKRSSTVQSTS